MAESKMVDFKMATMCELSQVILSLSLCPFRKMSSADYKDQKPSIDVDSGDQKATTTEHDAGRYVKII